MTESAAAPQVVDLLGYEVVIGPWLLDDAGRRIAAAAPAHTIAVVTDENVGPLAAPQLVGSLRHFAPHTRVLLKAIPAGESQKVRETWTMLTDWLLDERCGRDTTVVALGGGVVGDLAGFVAATFMRGVPFVQVPTTLLAMVDASVGGKVGVDTRHGKNLVGAFHQPATVLADPTVLQTLPAEHLRAGFAEVLKHGIIADAGYFARARQVGEGLFATNATEVAWHGDALADLVAGSVRIKAAVVSRDEREHGLRQVLNFGHTIGHAVELLSDFSMLHGEAIAIGMCVEARLAEATAVARPGLAAAVRDAVRAIGLPVAVPGSMQPDALIEAMRLDKKARAGRLVMALPESIGTMASASTGIPVDTALVRAVVTEA